jgi:hypothetical protein
MLHAGLRVAIILLTKCLHQLLRLHVPASCVQNMYKAANVAVCDMDVRSDLNLVRDEHPLNLRRTVHNVTQTPII